MTRRKKRPRVRGPWKRDRGNSQAPRYWGDFRYLGGKLEPLCLPGESRATAFEVDAQRLYAARVADLTDGTGRPIPPVVKRHGTVSHCVAQYVAHRRASSKATPDWLAQTEIFLGRAIGFFGADRPLRSVKPDDAAAWVVHLRGARSNRGRPHSEESIRKHIHTLSGLFRRAQRTGWVPPGYNPVSLLEPDERPVREASPDVWLEVHDGATLLEAARTYPVTSSKKRPDRLRDPRMLIAYPLLATFLLTGGRRDEVLGLDVADLLFDRKLVAFRPNAWRRGKKGKTVGSTRMVPMWPQLEAILREYLAGRHLDLRLRFDTTLLFPSPRTGKRIVDIRKLIDHVAKRAGLPVGRYRATAFRKTFATAALQLLDHGAPIAQRTVQGWLGHASGAMLEAVYGKLGTVRHRSEVLEYRSAAESNGAGNGASPSHSDSRPLAVEPL